MTWENSLLFLILIFNFDILLHSMFAGAAVVSDQLENMFNKNT